MDVNFFGACCVSQAFAPLLGAGRGAVEAAVEEAEEEEEEKKVNANNDKGASSSSSSSFSRFAASRFPVSNPGTIIQISSTAGKLSAPFIGAYAASKHALEAASDALRRELFPYKVDVLVVEPGAVATPIWDKAEHHDVSAYDWTPYKGPLQVFGDIVRAEGRVRIFEVFYSFFVFGFFEIFFFSPFYLIQIQNYLTIFRPATPPRGSRASSATSSTGRRGKKRKRRARIIPSLSFLRRRERPASSAGSKTGPCRIFCRTGPATLSSRRFLGCCLGDFSRMRKLLQLRARRKRKLPR